MGTGWQSDRRSLAGTTTASTSSSFAIDTHTSSSARTDGLGVALERTVRRGAIILVFDILLLGCGSSPTSPDPVETCEGFGDWQASPYVLPYAVGASYFVDQGNCSPPGNGHRGVTKFGYDFLMPIGTPIYAARAGLVTQVEESHFDGQVAATGFDNLVVIKHDDATTTLYGHLTHDGAVVSIGDLVPQGALVGTAATPATPPTNPTYISRPRRAIPGRSAPPTARRCRLTSAIPTRTRRAPSAADRYLARAY